MLQLDTQPPSIGQTEEPAKQLQRWPKAEIDKANNARSKKFPGTFRPFGIETYGTLGNDAREFIKELSTFAHQCNLTAFWQVRRLLTRGLSLALQRGNVVAILEGLQRAQVCEQAQNVKLNGRIRAARHANRGLDLS